MEKVMAEEYVSVTQDLLNRVEDGTFDLKALDASQVQKATDSVEKAIKETASRLNSLFTLAMKLKIQPVVDTVGRGSPYLLVYLQRRIV